MKLLPKCQRRRGGIGTTSMNRQQSRQTRLHNRRKIGDPLIRKIAPPAACIAHDSRKVAHFGPHWFMGKASQHRHDPCGIVEG